MSQTKAELESEVAGLRERVAELEEAALNGGTCEPYLTIVDALEDAIFMLGLDLRVQYVNPSALRLLHSQAADVVGQPMPLLFPKDLAAHMVESVRTVLDDGQPQMSETEMIFPGLKIWQHVSLVPLRDADGAVYALLGAGRDITERKVAEDAVLASEARYRALVDAVGDIVFVVGADDRVQYVNAGAAEWFNSSPEDLVGKPRTELFPENTEWGKKQGANLRRVFDGGESLYSESVAHFPEGSRWQGTSLAPVRNGDGAVVAVLGIGHDITARKNAEEELRVTNRELNIRLAQIERLSGEVAALNRMGKLLLGCRTPQEVCSVFSSFAAELFPGTSGGLAVSDGSGQDVETVVRWGDSSALERTFGPDDCWALRLGQKHLAVKKGITEKHIAMDAIGAALCVPLTAPGRANGVLSLVSDDESHLRMDTLQLHATSVADHLALAFASADLACQLADQAIHDPLTALYNRRFLGDAMSREFSRAKRETQSVAVLMFDADHFKPFNDQHGHAAGDEVLRALARAVEDTIRAGDVACRFGGDEIVLVLPGVLPEEAVARAEEIRRRVSGLALKGFDAPPLTVSAGVACFPMDGDTPEAVLAAADEALYRAKDGGRNRVERAG
jgi:diguanylate cyclase (GGDEF)-like protein/PAS domain S-box-containing protein